MPVSKLLFGFDVLFEDFSYQELKHFLTKGLPDDLPSRVSLNIIHSNQNCLTIGLSSEGCLLMFQLASGLPPYYSSVGDEDKTNRSIIRFTIDSTQQTTYTPSYKLVSFENMLQAVEEFLRTGILPRCIEWEED